MRRTMLNGIPQVTLAVCVLVCAARPLYAHPMERMDYWQKNYTEVTAADDPQAARAHAIFARVLQVADKKRGVVPRIFIAREDPLGISLPIAIPDGGIILSKKVLDSCYRDTALGDDRLAFVLAHELAHLLKDDFWHMKFFQTLEASKAKTAPASKEIAEIQRAVKATDQVLAKELQADEHGIVYASMAGFNTQAIVTTDSSVNFFDEWMRALTAQPLSGSAPIGHPSPAQRAAVVKARLGQIVDKVEVFHMGLRFYQTGQYRRAILAFQDFVQFFPSREVYHNLASSHHQLALQHYAQWKKDDVAFPFKLSLAIDPVTRASQLQLRNPNVKSKSPEELFTEHLDKAIEHYQTALSLDPTYALSYNNLGCALLLKGEVFKAIGTFQDALKLVPDAADTLNNLGVAFRYADSLPKAMEHLQRAHTLAPTDHAPVFNLGKLAADMGHMADAQRYWETSIKLAAAAPWAEVIQHKLGNNAPPEPWPAPSQSGREHLQGIRIGFFEKELPRDLGVPKELSLSLEQEPFKIALYPTGIITFLQDTEVLMLGSLAHYRGTSARGITPGSTVQDLLSRYGRPGKILRMTRGENWLYPTQGIAFQLRDGQVTSWLLF